MTRKDIETHKKRELELARDWVRSPLSPLLAIDESLAELLGRYRSEVLHEEVRHVVTSGADHENDLERETLIHDRQQARRFAQNF